MKLKLKMLLLHSSCKGGFEWWVGTRWKSWKMVFEDRGKGSRAACEIKMVEK
jgi:hypothetical protein